MDPNFHLIKLVDPSKSSSKIKDRFAKLTLSSNKKRQVETEQPQEQAEDSSTMKSNPSRKLFEDYLTDDDSDNEAEVLNRIFRSKTTTKTSDNGAKEPQKSTSVRRSRSFSQRLQMSDSDETNCSLEEAVYARRIQSEPMDRLQVSDSQPAERKSSSKLFTSNGITDKSDIPLQQISNRLSSLNIQETAGVNTKGSSDQRRVDAKLENVLKQQFEMKSEQVEETPAKPRYSVLTISSTATSPVSVYDEDDDSDIVIISESESDADDDYSYPVSTIRNTAAAPRAISETLRDRLDAFFENIPPLASNEGPERIFFHDRTLQESEGRSELIDESVPDESIEICESSAESGREPVPPELVSSPSKRTLRSAQTPTKVDMQSPQQATTSRRLRTPKKADTPEFIQKQATPRKTRTPRKMTPKIADTPLQESPSRRKLKMDQPVSSKKAATPKKTATTTPKAMPASPRTPRKTPTPKVRKKVETTFIPEPDSSPEESPALPEPEKKSPTPPIPRPSDAASSCSSEYRIEKINISATFKIRLQFNDDIVASVRTSPLTSSTSRLHRLTESESLPDPEERVHTPDHFKQRSIREQNTLTFIDITKNSVASQSSTVKEINSINNLSSNNVDTALSENQKEEPETTSSPQFPTLQVSVSPAKELDPPELERANPEDEDASPVKESSAREVSDIQDVLIPQNESTPARPYTEPPAEVLQKSSSPDEGAPIEIDDIAQKLLHQLYGDAWKTPALVKSMKKTRQPNELGAKDESMMDFSRFHTNIQTDLESTRLPENLGSTQNKPESDHVFKMPATERKVHRKKEEIQKKAVSERKPTRRVKGQAATQPARVICDTDLSDDDFNASSDESWKGDCSTSSSPDTDTSSSDKIRYPSTRKKKNKKAKKKNSSKDEVIYLDLSSDVVKVQEVNESPYANKDEAFQQRLEEFLDTFKCPDKKKIEPTPKNNKIKRKLFTPRFGEEDEASPVLSHKSEFQPTENDVVKLNAPLPPMFEPINKHLESVKTGKPIFSLNIPKIPKSVSKKNKENLPSKDETPNSTPKTKTSQRTPSRKREKFDSGLLSTPCDRYGFLQSLDVKVAKTFCHPEALIYREYYKSKKQELAEKLYSIYNANIFNNELNVALVWNKKLLNTAGRCSCSTKLGKRMCRIELSEKVLTSADRLRCTLIHELCHAATWIYSGEHGHGATWKKWARRANETFPELPKIQVCHDYDIDYKYTYKCTMCNAKSHAHSKSKKVENIRCAYCHGAIEVFLNKKDKDGNILPTPVREATGFAKFVKDNYKKHKRPDIKHADVMKLLSNEFALLNVDGKK